MRAAWNRARRSMTIEERRAACDHQWRFAGPAEASATGCWSPSLMVCTECDSSFVKACGRASARVCGYCSEIKRGDISAVGRSGWNDRPGQQAVWLTLTAPGESVLAFDRSRCTHGAGVKCSGAVGCQVESIALAWWHTQLPLAWSHYVTEVRRSLNKGCCGPPSTWPVQVEFFKTYEPQRRGALHVHAMVRVSGVVTARRIRAALRRAALMNGFGPQVKHDPIDISDPLVAARVAGYCAKYSTKSSAELPELKRYDQVTGEATTGGLRSWSASRRWGESMASVQQRRLRWWQATAAPALGSLRSSGDAEPPPLDSYCGNYADVIRDGAIVCPP